MILKLIRVLFVQIQLAHVTGKSCHALNSPLIHSQPLSSPSNSVTQVSVAVPTPTVVTV